jgi:ATP-dependent Clp protease protease subunit
MQLRESRLARAFEPPMRPDVGLPPWARFSADPTGSSSPLSAILADALLHERIIVLGTPIDASVANRVVAQLLLLARHDADRDIQLYLHVPGGDPRAVLAVHDTLTSISPPVATFAVGQTTGPAVLLLAAGARGKRFALPQASVALGPLQLGTGERLADALEAQVAQAKRVEDQFLLLLSRYTGRPRDELARHLQRQRILTPGEARDLGFVDQVIERLP